MLAALKCVFVCSVGVVLYICLCYFIMFSFDLRGEVAPEVRLVQGAVLLLHLLQGLLHGLEFVCVCFFVFMCCRVSVCVYSYLCVCVKCTQLYLYIYIYIYMYMCIHTNKCLLICLLYVCVLCCSRSMALKLPRRASRTPEPFSASVAAISFVC